MASTRKPQYREMRDKLRKFIRRRGEHYLRDPNVTSIGVGYKIKTVIRDGVETEQQTKDLSIQFTVGVKGAIALEAEEVETRELPREIEVDGVMIPTDVIQRKFEPSYLIDTEARPSDRKLRLDPMQPGSSIGHGDISAGTFGIVVYDRQSGAPCILSNWHVLNGRTGKVGDKVYQPGPDDDNDLFGNDCGVLLRSHLGAAGDCAVARIARRTFETDIMNLGPAPTRLARVDLGDRVVKSGRTTAVTYGVVRRVDVMAKINYGGTIGERAIGSFEIGPDADHPASDGEISRGGDSGSAWLILDKAGKKPTDIFAGLHFAGEGSTNPDEHALACYPRSVTRKLDVQLLPLPGIVAADEPELLAPRLGYDADFLGAHVPMPGLSLAFKRDAVNFAGTDFIPYTHFTVCLSKKRRMARFVAWNIDGARKVTLGSHSFRRDDRVSHDAQIGDDLYRGNPLDRGHLARRADLAWGPVPEAKQANKDSYFFTNIAPQHEAFNRSSLDGLWGDLENLILAQAATKDIRVSVLGGPVLDKNDPEFRGIGIPRSFWKVIAYKGEDDRLRTAAFVLSQGDLIATLERLDLDPFRLFQVTLPELRQTTGLDFSALAETDVMANPELQLSLPELAGPEAAEQMPPLNREITSRGDLVL